MPSEELASADVILYKYKYKYKYKYFQLLPQLMMIMIIDSANYRL